MRRARREGRGGSAELQPTAGLAALRTEVDHPVGGGDHVEVVLDDHERVSRFLQPGERREERRDVAEVQPGRRLVKEEQDVVGTAGTGVAPGQMARELQPLRLAAGERRDRLTEGDVAEPHVRERGEGCDDSRLVGEQRGCLVDGEVEYVRDRESPPCVRIAGKPDLEHLRAEPAAVTIRAPEVNVAQELHFDVLEAAPLAGRALTAGRVEAEGPGGVAALASRVGAREQAADDIERADVARRVTAGALADGRLVHEHHVGERLGPRDRPVPARFLGGASEPSEQRPVQNIDHQRALPAPAHAGEDHGAVERDGHVDPREVVLLGTVDGEEAGLGLSGERAATARGHRRAGRPAGRPGRGASSCRYRMPPGKVRTRQRRAVAPQRRRRALEDDRAPGRSGAGTEVDDVVRSGDHLRVVFDDHDRVARVAQAVQDADEPVYVARVEPDARLIQDEQSVHQRGAERGGEVDPLHFAPAERA